MKYEPISYFAFGKNLPPFWGVYLRGDTKCDDHVQDVPTILGTKILRETTCGGNCDNLVHSPGEKR